MSPSMLQLVVASLAVAGSYVSAYQDNLRPKFETRQTNATIKQTIGTWSYKGCYLDSVNRLLTFRFDVQGGNNAERCTSLCASKGYGLAGLEYGQQCWCDKYMPFDVNIVLKPDVDCSFTCPGDEKELCGAGDRLVLYQNSAGIPPDPSQCITWRASVWAGRLRAVNRDGTGSPIELWNYYINDVNDPVNYNIISGPRPDGPCRYGSQYWALQNFNFWGGYQSAMAIRPNIGDSQAFIIAKAGTPRTVNTTYCFKPSTYSPQGPLFGYPLLAVNGDTNKWGLCTNTTTGSNGRRDIVYSPIANHAHYDSDGCDMVNIEVMN